MLERSTVAGGRISKGPRRLFRAAAATAILLPLLLGLSPAPPTAHAQEAARSLNGFEVSGRFLEVWNRPGSEQASVYVNGLPITTRRAEVSMTDGRTYDTQWFERARFEAHPEYAPPNDVLLGLLGASVAEGRGSVDPATRRVRNPADTPFVGVDKPANTGPTRAWFPETRHTVSGKILEYWNRYGGLQQFGFPLSEPFREVSAADGKEYEVQYFERNRFELHPEKRPPYEVELGLLGVQQHGLAAVPAARLPAAPPEGIISGKESATIAVSQMPATLVPDLSTSFAAQLVSRPIFLQVVALDPQDNTYPELAWYVPTLENGGALFVGAGADRHLTIKIKLRQGVLWADGAEVTARDVVMHHRLMLDPRVPIVSPLRPLHLKIHALETPNPHTVLVRYHTYPQAAALLADPANGRKYAALQPFVDERRPVTDIQYNLPLGALPEHILGKVPPDQISRSDFALQPVGNGPYMVESQGWRGTNTLVLTRNPRYSLTAPPVLRRIIFRAISDATQAARQIAAGEIDAATRDVFSVPDRLPGYAAALDSVSRAGHKVAVTPSRTTDFLLFNLERTAFSNKVVRQGIAHAINRQRIVDRYWFGRSSVSSTFFPSPLWASSAHPNNAANWLPAFPVRQYPYDPERAAQLMEEAGYIKDNDGYRYREGARLIIEISFPARGDGRRTTDIATVQEDLKALGVEVRLKPVPVAGYTGPQGYLTGGQHDLAHITWSTGPDPLEAAQPFTTGAIPRPENGLRGANFMGFRNARYDELEEAASREVQRSRLGPIYAEMQSILAEELPAIPLATHPVIEAYSRDLVGWETGGNGVPATYRAAAFYFK